MTKPTPSWIHGAASVMALFPDTEAKIRNIIPQRSDSEAMYSDWQQVGLDILSAAKKCEDEQKAG